MLRKYCRSSKALSLLRYKIPSLANPSMTMKFVESSSNSVTLKL
jgi:hypothetical protein